VRHVAALPALSLLAGSACGLLLLEPPFAVVSIALTVSLGLAAWAIVRGRSRALAVAVACGFFAGGALVSAVEWQRAWRPTLRVAFEELARIQRADAVRAGRRTPLDDEAFAWIEHARPLSVTIVGTATDWLRPLFAGNPEIHARFVKVSGYAPGKDGATTPQSGDQEDLVVFDRWAPLEAPGSPALMIAPPLDAETYHDARTVAPGARGA
jgi:hypothetical protein